MTKLLAFAVALALVSSTADAAEDENMAYRPVLLIQNETPFPKSVTAQELSIVLPTLEDCRAVVESAAENAFGLANTVVIGGTCLAAPMQNFAGY